MKDEQERLHALAEALGMTHQDAYLSLSQDREKRWWLVGCGDGDCVLPRTRGEVTARDALEAAEGWLAPELGVVVEEKAAVVVEEKAAMGEGEPLPDWLKTPTKEERLCRMYQRLENLKRLHRAAYQGCVSLLPDSHPGSGSHGFYAAQHDRLLDEIRALEGDDE